MLEALNYFDHQLFLKIHHCRNLFLDDTMPFITSKSCWFPLYLFLGYVLVKRFGKQMFMIVVALGLLLLFTDQTSNLVKNSVCRLRPCHDPSISEQVITPVGCGGNYGFVSSHAANTFGTATFLWLLSGMMEGVAPSKKRKRWLWLFAWSMLVCWSRIYVGVHFPFDLIGGCVIGAFWGIVMFLLYKKIIHRRVASDR